jgi:hypothetical protein
VEREWCLPNSQLEAALVPRCKMLSGSFALLVLISCVPELPAGGRMTDAAERLSQRGQIRLGTLLLGSSLGF